MAKIDLVATPDIADRLGVAVGTVHSWRQRPWTQFPPPGWQVAGGTMPVWEWDVIAEWAKRTGRQARHSVKVESER